MTIQQIQYLIETAKHGSINQAAEALYVAQSSVSKGLRSLEAELGVELLNRSYNGIELTPTGWNFLIDSYQLISQYQAMQDTYTARHKSTETLLVSSQHYGFVLDAVQRKLRQEPDSSYRLSLQDENVQRVMQNVASGHCDLGFIGYYDMNKDATMARLKDFELTFHPLCRAQIYVYVSVQHPLAARKELTLADLESYPYLCYDYEAEHIQPLANMKRSVIFTDRHALQTTVSTTHGYAIACSFFLDADETAGVCKIPVQLIFGGDYMHMTACWVARKSSEKMGAIHHFLEYCREAIAAQEDLETVLEDASGLQGT